MVDFSAPLAGLDRASASLNKAAVRIARASDPADDTVDLSAEVVALLSARNDFKANAQVLRTEDELGKSLLSVLA